MMSKIVKVKSRPWKRGGKVKVHILDSLTHEVTLCGRDATLWDNTNEKVTCLICKRGGER